MKQLIERQCADTVTFNLSFAYFDAEIAAFLVTTRIEPVIP